MMGTVTNTTLYASVPVSYTHLDVYKRQTLHCGQSSSGKLKYQLSINSTDSAGMAGYSRTARLSSKHYSS